MVLSRSCEHAVRAILYLAAQPAGSNVRLGVIARQARIPYHFLGKICQLLVREGLLRSTKGRNGGFSLARPASRIRVLDVVAAVDGLQGFERCIMGLPECSEAEPCALHEGWKRLRGQLHTLMAAQSIQQLMRKPSPVSAQAEGRH